MWVWILAIIAAVGADQLSKLLIVRFLDKEEPFVIIKNVFRFSYVENRGAAFGMLGDHRWIFMIISTVAIIGLIVFLFRFCPKNAFLKAGLSLVIGGGIGNMIDRIALGYVVDFIDFYAFPDVWMWVFNVADAFVCVGAGMIALYLILDIIKEAKAEKAVKLTAENKTEENQGNTENEDKNG